MYLICMFEHAARQEKITRLLFWEAVLTSFLFYLQRLVCINQSFIEYNQLGYFWIWRNFVTR